MENPQSAGDVRSKRVEASLPPALRLYRNLVLLITALGLLAMFSYRHDGKSHTVSGIAYGDTSYALLQAGMWSAKDDQFGDFWHYAPLLQELHTAEFFTGLEHFAYPAPCAVAYKLLYATGPHAEAVFRGMIVAAGLVSGILLFLALRRRQIGAAAAAFLVSAMLLTSEPWIVELDRGNLEVFVYLFIGGGVWAYCTGRKTLAAALWGCAGAMKLYPIALLAMFLHRRTLRPLTVGIGAFLAMLIGSMAYVGPTIAIAFQGMFTGLNGFVARYAGIARRSELNSDHSLLGAIKEILSLHFLRIGTNLQAVSHAYEIVIAIVALLLYFLVIRKLASLNQLCVLLLCIIFIPPVSYDYTLIHMYLALGIVAIAYLDHLRAGLTLRHGTLYFVFFALLSTTLTWFHLRGLGFNSVLKAGSILGLLILLFGQPLTIESGQDRFKHRIQIS